MRENKPVEKVKVEFEVSDIHAHMLKALARLTKSTTNGIAKELVEAILNDDIADDARNVRD
jgi:hypothetical protein